MVEKLRIRFAESATARWTVLGLVSFTMLTGYIISDVMAPLKTMFEQQLHWDSSDYSFFTSGYSLFNVFLLMLIFGGMILDRRGSRFTGFLAVFVMIGGTLMKYWAISTDFNGSMTTVPLIGWQLKTQVFYATLGFAIFGVGIEMIGVTATKIIVKWFKGKSLALALGLNVAAGRIGTAVALLGAYPYAKAAGNNPAAPLSLCLIMLCIGLLTFLVFAVMDSKHDKHIAAADGNAVPAEEFKPSDIFAISRIRAFWYITLLCLLFYAAVFPFLKFATELMIQKFGISTDYAGLIPALIPFGNILLTPVFGTIYDRKGKGATIMIVGSVMLVAVHLLFAVPVLTSSWIAVALMIILGAAFSLVPSAMWPSVSKIVPERMLGTGFSMIFWMQNWGLWGMPLLIGFVLNRWGKAGTMIIDGVESTRYNYTVPMLIFALCGILSVLFALLLKREDTRKHYGLQEPNIQHTDCD